MENALIQSYWDSKWREQRNMYVYCGDSPYVWLWLGITPKGKLSKYYFILKSKKADGHIGHGPIEYRKKLPKGYSWTGPLQYYPHNAS